MPDQPRLPVTAEIDHGSTSSRGRPAGHTWLVRLRRNNQAVILSTGLAHTTAQRLADQINRLLHQP